MKLRENLRKRLGIWLAILRLGGRMSWYRKLRALAVTTRQNATLHLLWSILLVSCTGSNIFMSPKGDESTRVVEQKHLPREPILLGDSSIVRAYQAFHSDQEERSEGNFLGVRMVAKMGASSQPTKPEFSSDDSSLGFEVIRPSRDLDPNQATRVIRQELNLQMDGKVLPLRRSNAWKVKGSQEIDRLTDQFSGQFQALDVDLRKQQILEIPSTSMQALGFQNGQSLLIPLPRHAFSLNVSGQGFLGETILNRDHPGVLVIKFSTVSERITQINDPESCVFLSEVQSKDGTYEVQIGFRPDEVKNEILIVNLGDSDSYFLHLLSSAPEGEGKAKIICFKASLVDQEIPLRIDAESVTVLEKGIRIDSSTNQLNTKSVVE